MEKVKACLLALGKALCVTVLGFFVVRFITLVISAFMSMANGVMLNDGQRTGLIMAMIIAVIILSVILYRED